MALSNSMQLVDQSQILERIAELVDQSQILERIAELAAAGKIVELKAVYDACLPQCTTQQCHEMILVALEAVHNEYHHLDQDEKIEEIKALIEDKNIARELEFDALLNFTDKILQGDSISDNDLHILIDLLYSLVRSKPNAARIEMYKRNHERLMEHTRDNLAHNNPARDNKERNHERLMEHTRDNLAHNNPARDNKERRDFAFKQIKAAYEKIQRYPIYPEFEYLLTKTYFQLYTIQNNDEVLRSSHQLIALRLGLNVVKMNFNLNWDQVEDKEEMINLLMWIQNKTTKIICSSNRPAPTQAMNAWFNEWNNFKLKITTAHQKIKSITETYLARENLDAGKKAQFQSLLDILNRNDTEFPEYNNLRDFRSAVKTLDTQNLFAHRTSAWKRYLYNVLSILFVVPAIVRAAKSYAKYNTCAFWKSDAEKALVGQTKLLKA